MPRIEFAIGYESHEDRSVIARLIVPWRGSKYDIEWILHCGPDGGTGISAEVVRVCGAGSGRWTRGSLAVPDGTEITFKTERFDERGYRNEERIITCVADSSAPPVRISGHRCCGRVQAVEGPLRVGKVLIRRGTWQTPGGLPPAWIEERDDPERVPERPRKPRGVREDIPVFGPVRVRLADRFPRYVRMCSIHGEETVTGAAPIEWRRIVRTPEGLLAILLSAIPRAPSGDARSAVREILQRAPGGSVRAQHEATSEWLRGSLGTDRSSLLPSLEAIAETREPALPGLADPEVRARIEDRSYDPFAVGVHAAEQLVLPALAALTGSCAEYEVLEGAMRGRFDELYVEFSGMAKNEGTAYRAAISCVRIAADVLRNPYRYVL